LRILICAATHFELKTFLAAGEEWTDSGIHIEPGAVAVGAVIGVGIPQTLLKFPPVIQRVQPDWIVNIGIAGAYPGSGLSIGDIARVRSEQFGDVGFELPEEPWFRPILDTEFAAGYHRIALEHNPMFRIDVPDLKVVETDALTVSTCTGSERTGRMREQLFAVQIETMEGAAVALAAVEASIPVCEIRAISNIASSRDMRPSNIRLAIDNLSTYLQAWRSNWTLPK